MADSAALMAYLLPILQGQTTVNPSDLQGQGQITGDLSDLQGEIARGRSAFMAPVGSGSVGPGLPYGGGYYDTWDALGKMAGIVRQATGGGGGGDQGIKMERYVHGAPQGQPAKVPDPVQSFNFTTMNNPMRSVGEFLLSPAGQRLVQSLQQIGQA